jgi:hypothetical protein
LQGRSEDLFTLFVCNLEQEAEVRGPRLVKLGNGAPERVLICNQIEDLRRNVSMTIVVIILLILLLGGGGGYYGHSRWGYGGGAGIGLGTILLILLIAYLLGVL